jgi:hypothetical protein
VRAPLNLIAKVRAEENQQYKEFDMTDVQPDDTELSAQEFEIDPSAQDVEVSDVQTTGSKDVASQDPEAQEVGR